MSGLPVYEGDDKLLKLAVGCPGTSEPAEEGAGMENNEGAPENEVPKVGFTVSAPWPKVIAWEPVGLFKF